MLPAIYAAMAGIIGNVANVQQTRNNNALQERLVREANAASAVESQKAYERSKATNQAGLMQQAGMSKAGALNAINGGGSYTPAPVQSAQTQAPQIDLTHAFDGLVQVGENAKQRKLQKDLQEQQIKAAKQAQEAQFDENEKQRKHDALMKDVDTANQTQHDNLEYEKHKEVLANDYKKHLDRLNLDSKDLQLRRDSFEYGKKLVDAQTGLTEVQRDKVRAELDEWKKQPFVSARENKARLESLAAIYNYHITESDFNKYLQKYYTYDEDTDTWKSIYDPKIYSGVGSFETAGGIATAFWDCVFSVVPVRSLFGCIKLFGGSEKK